MTLPLALRANTELVTAAYIRQRIVDRYGVAVGGTLQGPGPDGILRWADTGFVQFTAVGGAIDQYVPLRHPVVSLDIWAANKGSKRPPWGKAYSIAETIIAATFDTPGYDTHAVVSLPDGYPDARVTAFSTTTEPSRRPSDQSDYAHLGFEVAIAWHGLGNTWTVEE